MVINKEINSLINENHGVITTRQVREIGFSRTLLMKYERAGLLERQCRGVYMLSEKLPDELYALSLRSDSMVFSHETALFLHGMAERAPLRYAITIPSDRSVSSSLKREVQCFYIQPGLFDLGLIKKETGFGHEVMCYDMERTICDMVRSRNKLEAETVLQALKAYARRKDRNLTRLFQYAKRLRIEKVLRLMFEVIA